MAGLLRVLEHLRQLRILRFSDLTGRIEDIQLFSHAVNLTALDHTLQDSVEHSLHLTFIQAQLQKSQAVFMIHDHSVGIIDRLRNTLIYVLSIRTDHFNVSCFRGKKRFCNHRILLLYLTLM
nr:MAG TPA: hypothetical protein [Caudoviricetes sp.]